MSNFKVNLAILLASAVALPSLAADLDDPATQYQTQLKSYYHSIQSFASEQLDEIYGNAGTALHNKFPRSKIKIEIRSGDDWLCYSDQKFKMGAVLASAQSQIIVVCEPDVANASDFFLAWLLVLSSLLDEVPISEDMRSPVPSQVKQAYKDRVQKLLSYYVSVNGRQKKERFERGVRATNACHAWQTAFLVTKGSQSLAACDRRNLSTAQDDEAAAWAIRSLQASQSRLTAQLAPAENVSASDSRKSAEAKSTRAHSDAIHAIRSEVFERMVFYVVAHEFGHISSDRPNSVADYGLQDEIEADRIAAGSINKFYARVVALPMLANVLSWFWQSTGRIADTKRASALHTVVFCDPSDKLTSLETHPLGLQLLRMMGNECPKAP